MRSFSLKYFFLLVLGLGVFGAQAQYWFGPTVGAHRTDFKYQSERYDIDSFSVSSDYGLKYGVTLIYQASDKYAVQGELNFERIKKKVRNLSGSDLPIYSNTNYNFLSLPLSLRWNFGEEPLHFYVSGGPKLNFWLSGSGELYLDEMNESRPIDGPVPYKIVFKQAKGGDSDSRALINANRVQYALQIGTGVYADLQNGHRLQFDLRYTFGHSNMAFNGSPDFSQFASYSENFEFRNNTLALSVAYLFLYDVDLQRKGKSTVAESNDKNKNNKRKKKKLF